MSSKKEKNKNKKKNFFNYYFLFVVLLSYIILFFINSSKTMDCLIASWNILLNILPVLVLVVFIMGISNYFLKPKNISKYLGQKSGSKGWILSAFFGILSHGPIYVWYPLLKDLKNHGMRTGLVVVFLYNRAIKIPLLPVMVFYFGIFFVIILCLYMIAASIIQGKIIDIIEKRFDAVRV